MIAVGVSQSVTSWLVSHLVESCCGSGTWTVREHRGKETSTFGSRYHKTSEDSDTIVCVRVSVCMCNSDLSNVVTSCVLKCPINLITNPNRSIVSPYA
jgi:hypothetical protein